MTSTMNSKQDQIRQLREQSLAAKPPAAKPDTGKAAPASPKPPQEVKQPAQPAPAKAAEDGQKKQERTMRSKTNKKSAKAAARKPVEKKAKTKAPAKAAAKPAAKGTSKRYDWQAAEAKAQEGVIAQAPPLAESTGHLGQLNAVVAAAKAKNLKELHEYKKLPPSTYGRKVVSRYAAVCLTALAARK